MMRAQGRPAALAAAVLLAGAAAGGERSGTAAAQQVPGEAARPPAWLARCFPHTGAPATHGAARLRRVEARELGTGDRDAGSVIVELRYPGLDGTDQTGRARFYVPPALRSGDSTRVPLVHAAGYELDEPGALRLVRLGYAVCTPHAHPLNPLGRGVHLDRAILHAARALPWVDPLRVGVQGGSAGGWMALMLAADAFPLVWAMPDVPPIHWGYNAAYIGEQQELAGPPPGSQQPRMPVLRLVGPIAEQSAALYGVSFTDPAFLAVSPLAHLDTITAPTQVTFSTADTLVPVDQVSRDLVLEPDRGALPAGFRTAMETRFPGARGKRTLLEALPRRRYALYRLPPDENPPRIGADLAPTGTPMRRVLPFSRTRTWSIVLLEEGPVGAEVGHFRYAWSLDREPFRRWAEERGVRPEQLTVPKLRRLMLRLRGEPWRPARVRPGGGGEREANLLDYAPAERADVLLGLAAFAAEDARALRLAKLYNRLSGSLRELGPRLPEESAAETRAVLAALRR